MSSLRVAAYREALKALQAGPPYPPWVSVFFDGDDDADNPELSASAHYQSRSTSYGCGGGRRTPARKGAD